jgi:hypothetical protein
MEAMKEQISKAIQEHLPAQVGDELRKLLEQAKKNEGSLAEHRGWLRDVRKDNDVLRKKLDAHSALDAREAAIAKREAEVSEREVKAEIFELNARLEAHKEHSDATKQFMLGLSRNSVFRREFYKSDSYTKPQEYHPDGNIKHYSENLHETHEETHTTREE